MISVPGGEHSPQSHNSGSIALKKKSSKKKQNSSHRSDTRREASSDSVPPFSPIITPMPKAVRRPNQLDDDSDREAKRSPIRIETRGEFKIAVSDEGYGANSTATFIRQHTIPLAREIEHARTLYIKPAVKERDLVSEIFDGTGFPEISLICTEPDIKNLLATRKTRSPQSAASEIMHGLFPKYSLESIRRMGRAQKYSPKRPQKRP